VTRFVSESWVGFFAFVAVLTAIFGVSFSFMLRQFCVVAVILGGAL
jgi:hypothetical protein